MSLRAMNPRSKWMVAWTLLSLATWAQAQSPGAQDREAIEPRVSTSSAAQPPNVTASPSVTAPPSVTAAPATTAPAPSRASLRAAPAPRPTAPSPGTAASAGTANPAGTAAGEAGTKAPAKANDRLELDATQISGNRELPRVMYVVPWRRPDMGEFAGRPPNSLLDEVLAPVDRDVFRRQNSYYTALQPDTTPASHKDEK